MAEQDTGFIPRLEALRGVAAVLVGFYHCGSQLLAANGPSRLYFGLTNGMGCVVVFFVLSGFVLARSLSRQTKLSFFGFVKKRAWRLFPAGVATVMLLTALHRQYGVYVGFEASFDPVNVLLNMLMLKSDINAVMWSMTVELFATPLIFLGTLAFIKHGPAPLLSAIGVLFALSFVGQYRDMIGANLAPLYAFVIGMTVHFEGERLASLIPSQRAALITVGGMLLFVASGALKPTAPLMILMETLAGAALVLSIVQFPTLKLLEPLDFSIVRFYGRISYSYYLLNPICMLLTFLLFRNLMDSQPALVRAVVMGVISMVVTTLPAYLSWRFIEVPGVSAGRTRWSYKQQGM